MSVNTSWASDNHTKVFYSSVEEKYASTTFYLFMLVYCVCTNSSIIAITQKNPRFHTPHFLLIVFYSFNDLVFCFNDSINKFIMLAKEMESPMWFCQTVGFLTSVTLLASIHLLGLISMERWVFFCKPYHYLKWMAMMNITIIAGGIYTVATIIMGVVEIYFPRNNIRPATLSCVSKDSNIVNNILFFGLYLLPSGAMTLFSLVQLFKLARRSPAVAPIPVSHQLQPKKISCITWTKLPQNHPKRSPVRISATGLDSPTSNPNALSPSVRGNRDIVSDESGIMLSGNGQRSCIDITDGETAGSHILFSRSQPGEGTGKQDSVASASSCRVIPTTHRQEVQEAQIQSVVGSHPNSVSSDENMPYLQLASLRSATVSPDESQMSTEIQRGGLSRNTAIQDKTLVQFHKKRSGNPTQNTDPQTSRRSHFVGSTAHEHHIMRSGPPQLPPSETPVIPAISFPAQYRVGTKIPISYKRVLKMILIVSGSFWLTVIPGFMISTWILATGYTWEDLNTRITPPGIMVAYKFAYFIFYDLSKILNPLVIYYTHPQLRKGLRKLLGGSVTFETVEG